jgi:hypothetical protein
MIIPCDEVDNSDEEFVDLEQDSIQHSSVDVL